MSRIGGFMFGIMKRSERRQRLKEKIVKNREVVLSAMASGIKGARQCPFLMGEKCIGAACEQFMELNITNKKGIKEKIFRCSIVETPLMLMELGDTIRHIIQEQLKTQELLCILAEEVKKNASRK